MESENKQSNSQILNNNIKSNILFQQNEDSETFENSSKNKCDKSSKNSSIDILSKNLQKSLGFFPKKNLNINIPEEKFDSKRNNSMDEKLVLKNDFVPHWKPIEIHLVPSKLRLNKKGFKDLKCNKDNKILLLSNNYFISCPNSEEEEFEEDESDIDFSPELSPKNEEKNINIKDTRKNLHKMKSGSLPKVLSRNLIECKKYKEDMKIEYDSSEQGDNNDSFDLKEDNNNLLLYDENDFINYTLNNNNNKDNNIEDNKNANNSNNNKVRPNRINSCSILDVLKNRLSFDEPL